MSLFKTTRNLRLESERYLKADCQSDSGAYVPSVLDLDTIIGIWYDPKSEDRLRPTKLRFGIRGFHDEDKHTIFRHDHEAWCKLAGTELLV